MSMPAVAQAVLICVALCVGWGRATPARSVEIEQGVLQCTIKGADLLVRDAAAIDGGIYIQKRRGWGWSPKVGQAEGVLVVHPVSPERPAQIVYDLKGETDLDKVLTIVARGSDFGPGVADH
jgi:hypothetical protein